CIGRASTPGESARPGSPVGEPGLPVSTSVVRRGVNEFDEAVLVLVATDRDDQIGGGADDAVAERHAPQAVFTDLLPTRVTHGAQEPAGARVEGVDLAAVLVADQQRVGEPAPGMGRDDHAPRTVKDATGH